jgi:hypothetical protein
MTKRRGDREFHKWKNSSMWCSVCLCYIYVLPHVYIVETLFDLFFCWTIKRNKHLLRYRTFFLILTGIPRRRRGWCTDPHFQTCTAYVFSPMEAGLYKSGCWYIYGIVPNCVMFLVQVCWNFAPVFSRYAWRCVWHMIQVYIAIPSSPVLYMSTSRV